MIDDLRGEVGPRPTAKAIAQAVGRLIKRQEGWREGTRLPTVRAVAVALGVSPATISDAWRLLVEQGLVETQGRRGSFIRSGKAPQPLRRFRHVAGAHLPLDLSTGYPAPELMVDLRPFLVRAAAGPPCGGYRELDIDQQLEPTLRATLPFRPEAVIVATDSLVAMAELLPVVAGFGQRVVVGEAHFAPDLDLIERFGLVPVPVPMDDEGMDAAAAVEEMDCGARVLIVQPRVHNPTGIVTSFRRLETLARACARRGVWILENDYFGGLASSPPLTAATWWPDRTVHVRSFSKDLHPDLRICAIAGPADLIRTLQRRRVGGSWTSRVNQDLLRLLLESEEVVAHVANAKQAYDARRRRFVESLAENGVSVRSRDGLNVWVPVWSEREAMLSLAGQGVSVAPGSAFHPRPVDDDHVRVSIARLSDNASHVAAIVAAAATRQPAPRPGSNG